MTDSLTSNKLSLAGLEDIVRDNKGGSVPTPTLERAIDEIERLRAAITLAMWFIDRESPQAARDELDKALAGSPSETTPDLRGLGNGYRASLDKAMEWAKKYGGDGDLSDLTEIRGWLGPWRNSAVKASDD